MSANLPENEWVSVTHVITIKELEQSDKLLNVICQNVIYQITDISYLICPPTQYFNSIMPLVAKNCFAFLSIFDFVE